MSSTESNCATGPRSCPCSTKTRLIAALRTVKDPELNVNVIDLGLIYSIQTHESRSTSR